MALHLVDFNKSRACSVLLLGTSGDIGHYNWLFQIIWAPQRIMGPYIIDFKNTALRLRLEKQHKIKISLGAAQL